MAMAEKSFASESQEATPERKQRVQVSIDPGLARQIKLIAAALDMSLPDWVNNQLRPIVATELPKVLDNLGLAKNTEK
jgi:predicted HicB family RNase H-like nuclease